MFLIKLVMCAFGSYADENIIDFSHKQEGVFLITGDTGSGKTTIFDAITFALYGKTSGDRREGAMMRSQYARKDQASYVEFTFRIKRDEYVIRRNPAYQIETHYKNGKVKMVSKEEAVTLYENGQEFVTTRKSEVNKRILDILKVDFEQFTQIAMIAQGQFMKLLTAETKKKKEIFSKLFHTGIYQDIAKELEQKCMGYYRQLKDEELLCRAQIAQAEHEDPEWEQVKELPLSRGSEILDCLKERIEKDRCLLKEKQAQLEELTEQQGANQDRISKGEALLKLYEELEQLLNDSKAYGEDASLLPKRIKALKEEEMGLQPQYHKVGEARKVFEQLEKTKEKEAELSGRFDSCMKQIRDKEQDLLGLQTEEQNIAEEILRAGNPEKDRILILHDLESLESEQQAFEQLDRLFGSYKEQKTVYGRLVEKTRDELSEKNRRQKLAAEAEDLYFLAQAGILAEHLAEGMPCPVCGSTEHPSPTGLCEGAPAKETLDQLKEDLQSQESILQAQMIKEGTAKERLLQMKERLEETCRSVCKKELSAEEMCREDFAVALDEVKKKYKDKNEARKEAERGILRVKQLKQKMEAAAKDRQTKGEELESLKGKKETLQVELAKTQEGLSQLKAQTMDKSKDEVEAEWSHLKEQLDRIQNTILKINEMMAKMDLVKQQIDNRPRPDLTEDYAWREESRLKKLDLDQAVQTYLLKVNNNEQCYAFLNAHLLTIQTTAEKYQTYLTLHETANGKVSGKVKIDFETYVQRQYLKKILHAANKRLYEMSMGQFILKIKDLSQAGKAGNEGLDLYVHSLVTDSDRDVKTLSGGESFIAALSMALGLSDVVTRTVGSIHLNLMFIDEGFGSLDDASRNQAIKILNSLAGTKTLVGIISHVSELKEQIDEKLVVTKGERGSSVCWEKF